MAGIDWMQGKKGNRKKKDVAILEEIIFHLSEAYKLFNGLKDRRISTFEQSQWENAVKSCEDAIEFINAKVDIIGKILK